MIRRMLMLGALALTALAAGAAFAQETVKIGLILPMTGPFASTGRQIDGAVKLWIAQNGDTVAGKKIEVILKDDAGTADTTRRLAQGLVVNDKVQVLAGFGLTPLALATVPIATQAKIPELVMAAATFVLYRSPPLAGVMAVAMLLNMLLASAVGVLCPLILGRIGRDPVQGSSILLTAITDSMGFLIFLGLASALLI